MNILRIHMSMTPPPHPPDDVSHIYHAITDLLFTQRFRGFTDQATEERRKKQKKMMRVCVVVPHT